MNPLDDTSKTEEFFAQLNPTKALSQWLATFSSLETLKIFYFTYKYQTATVNLSSVNLVSLVTFHSHLQQQIENHQPTQNNFVIFTMRDNKVNQKV